MIFYKPELVNMPIPRHTAPLLTKKSIASNMLEFCFAKPADFAFSAGQFVQIMVPGEGKETPRSYSISAAPHHDYLEFCVKILPDGLGSTYLKNLDVGQEIVIHGPLGRFTNQNDGTPMVFVATGAGLAPIMSIIEDELKTKKNHQPLQLIFGVRSEGDIFWQERLDALQADYENFSYTLTLSQPAEVWSGNLGRVTAHLANVDISSHFFLCGSADMVKDVRQQLLSRSVPTSAIHLEVF